MGGKNWTKFPVLFSLYVAQSIPMSFFSTVVPVIMRQENYSLQSIGLLQLVKLPWIFKFLWAPLVDSHSGKPGQLRRWIIFSEIFYAAVILSIGFFDLQTDFRLIVILMIIAFIASATQDIAVDIFAIFQLSPGERSIGNSVQSAGSFTGTLFGGFWADVAWGRFWGWDPKENGALLVILWSMIAFHLRLGRLISPLGFAIFGASGLILIALTWFGVNLLGVGLHSYGFENGMAWALAGFIGSDCLLIAFLAFCSRHSSSPGP